MIKKSFGKILLSGTLAFTAMAATSVSDLPILSSQAEAAVYDAWPYQTYSEVHHNTYYSSELAPGDLRLGNEFSAYFGVGGGDNTVVKIYKIANDGSLRRYKTIYDSDPDEYSGAHITTITTGYPTGTYIAVLEYAIESDGQFYHDYYNGGTFKITQ